MLVANLDASDYLGRIAIGRIFNGRVKVGDPIAVCKLDGTVQQTKVTKLFAFDGLKRIDITEAAAGDIVCLAGHRGHHDRRDDRRRRSIRVAMPPIAVDEPTVSMIFGVNTSPMSGPRRPVRHLAADQGSARARAARQRVDPRRADRHARADEGARPRRAAAVDPDRDDAARRVRAAGLAARHRDEGGRRQDDGAGRGPGHRRRRGVPGRGDRAGRHAPRHDDEDGEPRQRPRAARVPHPGARPDRLPVAVPDRHQGHRDHEPPVRRLGAVARRDRRRA